MTPSRLSTLVAAGALVGASLLGLPAPAAVAVAADPILPVTEGVVLVESGADEIEGKRAIAGDGSQFLVVWRDDAADIIGALVGHDMATITEPFTIFAAGNDAGRPSVGFDGTDFVVFFEHIPAGEAQWELYGARVATNGTVLDPGGIRLTTGANMKEWRRVGVAFDGSHFLVVWRSLGSDVYASRIDPTPAVTPPHLENLDGPTGVVVSDVNQSFYPTVAYDGTNYLAVWYDARSGGAAGYDIYAARITTAGVVLDPDGFLVADGTEHMSHTGVDFDGTNYLIAWMDDRAGVNGQQTIYGARVSPAGAVLDPYPHILIADNRSGGPAAVVSDGDGWLVGWMANLGGGFDRAPYNRLGDVMVRQVNADGSITRLPMSIGAGEGHQTSAALAYDSGTFLAAWSDGTDVRGVGVRTLARAPGPLQPTAVVPVATGWTAEAVPSMPYTYAGERFISDISVHSVDDAVASAESAVYRRTAAGWAIDHEQTDPSTLWGLSADPRDGDRAWTVGWCGQAYEYDSTTGSWTGGACFKRDPGDPSHPPGFQSYGVALTADGWAWLSNTGGEIHRNDPATWTAPWSGVITGATVVQPIVTPNDLFDIWGTAADGLWAVGANAAMVRYDGVTWAPVGGLPTVQTLNAVHGSAPDNVIAVGDYGTILRWDGATWTAMDGGTTSHLFDVWVGGHHDAYAVGYDGTVTHFDGTSWTPQMSGTAEHLYAAGGIRDPGTGMAHAWVGGNAETILHQAVPLTVHPVAVTDVYAATEDMQLATTAGVDGVLFNDWDPEGQEGSFAAVLLATTRHGALAFSADGSFTYDPDEHWNGTDSFWYRVEDGHGGLDAAEVVIEVAPVNDPPVAGDDPDYVVEEEGHLEIWAPGVLANDADPVEGDLLEAVLVEPAQHGGMEMTPDGHFWYGPHQNFWGTDTFTYRAWDGTDYSNVATVTITVTPVNDPPVANPDGPWGVNEGNSIHHQDFAQGVVANDVDDETPLTALVAELVDDVAHGTLALDLDGTFSYWHDGSETTQDGFTYRVHDGEYWSDPAAVSFTIGPVNDPPTAGPDGPYATTEDAVLQVPAPGVLGNDDDADGDPVEALLLEDALYGTLDLASDGGFTYDPGEPYIGTDSFRYRAWDGEEYSAPVTVEIDVAGAYFCNGLHATHLGTLAADVITGGPGDDVILGRFGDDVIEGGGGHDVICAGAGRDLIVTGPGDDWIDGGPGGDTIDYSGAPDAVAVNLQLRRATGGHGTDTIRNVEHLVGSGFADTLRGNAKANLIRGGAGDDGIQGLGGDDELYGEAGDDNLNGRRGDDLLDGGPGIDQGTFLHSAVGLSVDLQIAGAQPTGDGIDQLVSIENLLGSRFADVLMGNAQPNVIKGSKGGDSLYGRGGDDLLIGNIGADWADGGPGTDTCRTEATVRCE